MSEVQFKVDPTGYFGDKGVASEKLVEAAGILPQFWMQALFDGAETAEEIMDAMVAIYRFGDYRDAFSKGTVDSEGVYTSEYEEDPPMYPLLKGETDEGQKLYVYQYAILAVVVGNSILLTRMD